MEGEDMVTQLGANISISINIIVVKRIIVF